MNGSPNGVNVAGNVITANYSATYGPLAPGGTIDLRFRATLGSTLAAGTIVTNTGVVTWNIPSQTASASVTITVGGIVGAPNLVFTKSGPATMSVGQWGQFGFNVQNTGTSDAWNATLLDRLPSGATGGMCNMTPQVLTAQVFQADGVTPVAGKGPLVPGTDFSISYVGATHLQAHADHAYWRDHDQPDSASDHYLPDPTRRQQPEWRPAHQHSGRSPVVRCRQQRHDSPNIHSHVDRRHAGHPRFPGRPHRHSSDHHDRHHEASQRRRRRRCDAGRAT